MPGDIIAETFTDMADIVHVVVLSLLIVCTSFNL